jgi:chromosome segregation ATPase
MYSWLDQNYSQGSKSLKQMKDHINESCAHANIVYAENNFNPTDFSFSFFDQEHARQQKSPLEPIVKKVRTDTIQALRELKDIVNAHTEVLKNLEFARTKLVDLRSVDIETKERCIDEETSQIQARLEQLKIERQLLAKHRLDIKSLEKEINSLTQRAEDPEVLDAKTQLEELRALLG